MWSAHLTAKYLISHLQCDRTSYKHVILSQGANHLLYLFIFWQICFIIKPNNSIYIITFYALQWKLISDAFFSTTVILYCNIDMCFILVILCRYVIPHSYFKKASWNKAMPTAPARIAGVYSFPVCGTLSTLASSDMEADWMDMWEEEIQLQLKQYNCTQRSDWWFVFISTPTQEHV